MVLDASLGGVLAGSGDEGGSGRATRRDRASDHQGLPRRRRGARVRSGRAAVRIVAILVALTVLLVRPAGGGPYQGDTSTATHGTGTEAATCGASQRAGAMQHISFHFGRNVYIDGTTRHFLAFSLLPRSAPNVYNPALDDTYTLPENATPDYAESVCHNPESAEVWYATSATKTTAENAVEAARVTSGNAERNLRNPPSGVSAARYIFVSNWPLAASLEVLNSATSANSGWYCAMARINYDATISTQGPSNANDRGVFTDVHCVKWINGYCTVVPPSSDTDCVRKHV